jgi:hypothetical protein
MRLSGALSHEFHFQPGRKRKQAVLTRNQAHKERRKGK